MGFDYYYANDDRLEYFDVGLLSASSSFHGIGRWWGARALGLLLLGENTTDKVTGRWASNRVSIKSYDAIHEWTDLLSDAFLMLLRHDRDDFLAFVFSKPELTFVLGDLVLNQGAHWLEYALQSELGENWKAKHLENADDVLINRRGVPKLLVPELADKS